MQTNEKYIGQMLDNENKIKKYKNITKTQKYIQKHQKTTETSNNIKKISETCETNKTETETFQNM